MWFYIFVIYLQNDFSADVFLQDLWHKVPLEVLRDDLGSYLKVLVSKNSSAYQFYLTHCLNSVSIKPK